MNPSQLIAALNSMSVGDLESIRAKLAEAGEACRRLGQVELADRLDLAREALATADLRTYRKQVETVISRLGHLR